MIDYKNANSSSDLQEELFMRTLESHHKMPIEPQSIYFKKRISKLFL